MAKIKDNELKALLSEMESDLQKAYELEKDKLVKAAGEQDDDQSAPPPAEGSDSAPAESASPEASDASAPVSAPPGPDASAAPPPGPADASAAPADPAAQDPGAPLTPEALQAEYSQLAPEELDMHIKAALAAKEALAASAAPAPGADASAPPGAPPAAPPAPAADPSADPNALALKGEGEIAKEELKVDKKAIGGKLVPVKKSEDPREAEIAELKALAKSQAEDIEILTKSVKMVMEQPLRKAVTSVAFVPKVDAEPKTFSTADVQRLIKEGAHKLSKAERDLVLDFYDGKVPASKLEPVLEKLTTSK